MESTFGEDHALALTLWCGWALVLLSLLASMVFAVLDRRAEAGRLTLPESQASLLDHEYDATADLEDSEEEDDGDEGGGGGGEAKTHALVQRDSCCGTLQKFSLPFWLVCICITFFYSTIFPFLADAPRCAQPNR